MTRMIVVGSEKNTLIYRHAVLSTRMIVVGSEKHTHNYTDAVLSQFQPAFLCTDGSEWIGQLWIRVCVLLLGCLLFSVYCVFWGGGELATF